MKLKTFSKYDIVYHLKENRTIYFMFLFCAILGIVLGFVVMFSSDGYLKLLNSENKSLYPFITGTATTFSIFWKTLISFFTPLILIFLLNLNYYSGLISYVFITYQSALLILSCASIVGMYGVSGVINIILIVLPVNIVYLCVLVFFSVACLKRSKNANQMKMFKSGFDKAFFVKVLLSIAGVFVVTIIACLVYPLFLKNSIFIIF